MPRLSSLDPASLCGVTHTLDPASWCGVTLTLDPASLCGVTLTLDPASWCGVTRGDAESRNTLSVIPRYDAVLHVIPRYDAVSRNTGKWTPHRSAG